MNARITILYFLAIIACSEEEAPVKMPEPLPEITLQFQTASMTIMECQIPGWNGEPTPIVILTNVAVNAPTLYYVIMKYQATDLGNNTFDSRIRHDLRHPKFDGTTSAPVIITNFLDETSLLTTIFQMEFAKGETSSFFQIMSHNNDISEADEIVTMEVVTTNPVSGACPSPQLRTGERKILEVTIEDFH